MNDNAKSFYKPHLNKWGLPQNYKGVVLNPIKILDEDIYYLFSKLMCQNKNIVPNKDIIKMSYLKYITYCIPVSYGEIVLEEFKKLMSYITNSEIDLFYLNLVDYPESVNDFKVVIKIGEEEFTEVDFDNMREIILAQNGLSIEYVNEFDPSLEESLDFINRNSNSTLEERLFAMAADAGQPISAFQEYTFYQFQKHFERLGLNIEYKTFKPLEVSGQISFKHGGGVDHWLKHIVPKGRYDSILVNKNTFIEQSDVMKVAQSK